MKRKFIVGDIHGCYDEFIKLLDKVGFSDEDQVISVGDIVDRGSQSLELYHFFKDRKNAQMIMGNHERKHLNQTLSYSQEIVKLQFGEEYEGFLKWLEDIPYYLELEEAIIIHAFFEHDQPLEDQREVVLAGTISGAKYLDKKYPGEKYWQSYYTGDKPVIYGHHVVGDRPKILNNTYGLDTAACHGGYLTALELPAFKIHQIKVSKDHWKEEIVKWQIPVLKAKGWEDMPFPRIRRQLVKLDNPKNREVHAFLNGIRAWTQQLDQTLETIKEKFESLSKELEQEHGKGFNEAVQQLPYKVFLFKAQKRKLNLEEVKQALNTPNKVLEMAKDLGIECEMEGYV